MAPFARLLLLSMLALGCDRRAPEGAAPSASAQPTAHETTAPLTQASATASASNTARAAPLCRGTAATRPLFDDGARSKLPRRTPEEAGLDGSVLDQLIDGAGAATSDALLVIRDDHVVVERTWGAPHQPIETRSITKGLAALGILALVADGAIASLDEPLSAFFPEFSAPPKASITLRHVLTHTSGLSHAKLDADALNAQADRTAYARALRVTDPPGTLFSYSNEATQLLSAVIELRAKEPADRFVARRIFAPLGIRDFTWKKDRAGNPQTYYGVSLHAEDLAKIGRMILHEGVFEGERVLPAELTRQLLTPSTRYGGYGLCFWLDPPVVQRGELRAKLSMPGFDVSLLAPFDDRTFPSGEDYFREVKPLLEPGPYDRLRTLHRERRGPLATAPGQARALIALGGLGQRLEVHPSERLVAVRQHRRRPGDDAKEKLVTFRAMQELLYRLPARCP